MLSTQYRLRLEAICEKIVLGEDVSLPDMIWAEKLAKSHTTAKDWLQKARRQSAQDIEDVDLKPNINIELVDPDSRHSMSISTKKRLFLQVTKSRPFRSNSPLMHTVTL